jgi:hypothetical protein
MGNTFAYVILQYCHSVMACEAINVGVLFKFANENRVRICLKENHRLDLFYRNFDGETFTLALEHLKSGLNAYNLEIAEHGASLEQNFTELMRHHLKWQDSALQFSDPFLSVGIASNESTMEYYAALLLNN